MKVEVNANSYLLVTLETVSMKRCSISDPKYFHKATKLRYQVCTIEKFIHVKI